MKDKLNDLCSILEELENDENERLKEITEVQDKVEQFNSIARPLKDKLVKLEKSTSKQTLYGADKEKSLEIQEDVNKQLRQVDNLKARASELNDVVDGMQKSQNPRKYDEFICEEEDITRRLDELKEALVTKGDEVGSIISEWDELERDVKKISETVDLLDANIEENKVDNLDMNALTSNIKNVEEVLEKLNIVQPDFDDVKKRGRKLQEKGVGAELVGEILPNIDDKVRSIQHDVPEKISELEKLADSLKSFNDDLSDADHDIHLVEELVDEQKPVGGDKEIIDQQMKELKELIVKLDLVNSKVCNLKDASSAVKSKYPDADSHHIDEPLKKVTERLTNVNQNIGNRQCKLEDALVQCGQFNDAIQSLLGWLIETSELISNQKPTSGVDHNVLKAQLQEQKVSLLILKNLIISCK